QRAVGPVRRRRGPTCAWPRHAATHLTTGGSEAAIGGETDEDWRKGGAKERRIEDWRNGGEKERRTRNGGRAPPQFASLLTPLPYVFLSGRLCPRFLLLPFLQSSRPLLPPPFLPSSVPLPPFLLLHSSFLPSSTPPPPFL